MKREEIHLGDMRRWLLGETTPEFMLETAMRTILVYLILLLTVRLMGKRMSAQLTITEVAVMITLGAIGSPSMQLPDRGLLFAAVGLFVALIFQRGLNLWAFKNVKVERLSQGSMITLVKDGELVLDELNKTHITRQQVFAMLREKDIQNLGSVQRAYLEACGVLSIFEQEHPKPGLSVLPPNDPVVKSLQSEAPGNSMACSSCGHVQVIIDQNTSCANCHQNSWIKAYVVKQQA